MEYKNKHLKTYEKEHGSKFNDYGDQDVDGKEKFINEKLGQLPIRQLTKQIKIDETLWGFDVVSLYPSAMWDEKSIYPRNETRYAYSKDMNGEIVETFNNQTFTQSSAILIIKY